MPSFFETLRSALTLPFQLTWKVIVFPPNVVMMVLVDKIQGDGWYGTKYFKRILGLDESPRWKKAIQVLKDFRPVLQDYYKWPKLEVTPKNLTGPGGKYARDPKCSLCPGKGPATWYDVDEDKLYCSQCCYVTHLPGSVNEKNSVEKVAKKSKTGFHIITPVLPEIMSVVAVYMLFFHSNVIHQNYLTSQVVCPTVNHMRGFTAWIDANLLYWYKQYFFEMCDFEDNFMRHILDLWTRGIVLDTDNTAILLQTFPKAAAVNMVLFWFICPLLSSVYALLMETIYLLENRIPREKVPEFLKDIEAKVNGWEKAGNTLFQLFTLINSKSNFPPETEVRKRPDKDILEKMSYHKKRLSRYYMFYFDSSKAVMQSFVLHVVYMTFIFRMVLIQFHLGPIVATIAKYTPFFEKSLLAPCRMVSGRWIRDKRRSWAFD
jgi:hypothetical protein